MSKIFRFGAKMGRMVREWRAYVEKIARAAREVLGDCEVYAFGSVVEGVWTSGSDVDILIVCEELRGDRADLKAEIEERAGLPPSHPFEIHLVSGEEAEWFRRHARKMLRIV